MSLSKNLIKKKQQNLTVSLHEAKEIVCLIGVVRSLLGEIEIKHETQIQLYRNIDRIREILLLAELKEENK